MILLHLKYFRRLKSIFTATRIQKAKKCKGKINPFKLQSIFSQFYFVHGGIEYGRRLLLLLFFRCCIMQRGEKKKNEK